MSDQEDRINELEMKLTYQQETIDALNETVTDQWGEIERLKNMIPAISERLIKLEEGEPEGEIAPPPHY